METLVLPVLIVLVIAGLIAAASYLLGRRAAEDGEGPAMRVRAAVALSVAVLAAGWLLQLDVRGTPGSTAALVTQFARFGALLTMLLVASAGLGLLAGALRSRR